MPFGLFSLRVTENSDGDRRSRRLRRCGAAGLAGAALAVSLCAVATNAAVAQTTPASKPIASTLTAHLVTKDDEGAERFQQAQRVNPGDVIEYRIVHRNKAGQALKGFVVNGKIPTGTVYMARSAKSAQADALEVKIAGEPWQGLPAFKTVTDADGNEQRVQATPADYIGLRWKLADALENGAQSKNIYRVQVAQ